MSLIQGVLTPERATTMSGRGRGIDPKGGQPYSAAALSLVYHPAHPFVPTLRADVRLFQVNHIVHQAALQYVAMWNLAATRKSLNRHEYVNQLTSALLAVTSQSRWWPAVS